MDIHVPFLFDYDNQTDNDELLALLLYDEKKMRFVESINVQVVDALLTGDPDMDGTTTITFSFDRDDERWFFSSTPKRKCTLGVMAILRRDSRLPIAVSPCFALCREPSKCFDAATKQHAVILRIAKRRKMDIFAQCQQAANCAISGTVHKRVRSKCSSS